MFLHTVDFVLRDPRERDDDKQEEMIPHRAELSVVPKPWNKSFLAAQSAIVQELDITNPTMLQVLELWHVSFGWVKLSEDLIGPFDF